MEFEGKIMSCSNGFGMGVFEVVDVYTGTVQSAEMSGPYGCVSSAKWGVYAIASYAEKCAFILSHDQLLPVHFVDHKHGVYAVVLAYTKPHVLSGDGAGIIKISDFVTKQHLRDINIHTNMISDLYLSLDDEILLVASADCTASVVSMHDFNDVMRLTEHKSAVSAIALLANGLTIVTGSSDGVLKCWNSITGELMLNRIYHTRAINAFAVHPDGALFATGSADKTIALWSTDDITPLGAIACASCVGSLVFMGHSHMLLAGVFNHGVLGYDCITGQYIRTFATHKYAVWGLAFDDVIPSTPPIPKIEDPHVALLAKQKRRTYSTSQEKPETLVPPQVEKGSVELFAPRVDGKRVSWTGRRSGVVRPSIMVPSLSVIHDEEHTQDAVQAPPPQVRDMLVKHLPRLKSNIELHVKNASTSPHGSLGSLNKSGSSVSLEVPTVTSGINVPASATPRSLSPSSITSNSLPAEHAASTSPIPQLLSSSGSQFSLPVPGQGTHRTERRFSTFSVVGDHMYAHVHVPEAPAPPASPALSIQLTEAGSSSSPTIRLDSSASTSPSKVPHISLLQPIAPALPRFSFVSVGSWDSDQSSAASVSRRPSHMFGAVCVSRRTSLAFEPVRCSNDSSDDDDQYAALVEWEQDVICTPISDWTVDDVRVLCIRQNITVDDDILSIHLVDGKKLLKFKNPATMMRLVGTQSFGDATYLLQTVAILETEKRLIDPRKVDAADIFDSMLIDKWGLQQTCEWLTSVGLEVLQDVFMEHHIAGDVLFHLDVETFALAEDRLVLFVTQLKAAIDKLKHDSEASLLPDNLSPLEAARALIEPRHTYTVTTTLN